MPDQPFTLGVNYWPRRKAMYWWSNFDRGEVREEFAIIRDCGLSLVRIFLLWDDFQPAPDQVSPQCLDHLTAVCEAAADQKLKLDVTFFTGHMSGPNWSPRWLLDDRSRPGLRQVVSAGRVIQRGYRNPFTDPVALQAERLLLSTVVKLFKDHSALGIWNLGNEPDLFAQPPTASAGRDWVHSLAELIHSIDDRHPVTCGLHLDSLLSHNGFRVDQVFQETDVAVMHAYSMYVNWARQPLDPDVVPFACALTSALCGRPALLEEFGGCTAPDRGASQMWEWTAYGQPRRQFMAAEDDLAQYFETVLPKLIDVGATGALLWCFADYAPDLWNKPPCDEARHERFFGMVRPDGSLKPHASVIRKFAETRPCVKPAAGAITLPMTADEFYRDPAANAVKLYRNFVA